MQGNRQPEDQQASSSPRSRLLQLPKELQSNIWEYALIEQDPIPFFTTGSPHTPGNSRRSCPKTLRWYIPPLLQTCRTCRIEGLPVFYASNLFILEHEPIFDDYDQALTLFERYWHHLASFSDFGIECKLPSSTTFLLRGQRKLLDNGYAFEFTSDAAPSHQRPLTALEASETDSCLCMIKSMIKKRRYATIREYANVMIAFLAAFAEKMARNELRVLRCCGECGKKMVEQKPRRPRWEDLDPPPPISMPMQSSIQSMDGDE